MFDYTEEMGSGFDNVSSDISGDTEAPLTVALREIEKGIAAARDTMTFVTDPAVLGDAVCELAGLTTELDSLRMELVAQAEYNGVPQTGGVRTMGQYVAARTNNSAARTTGDCSLAKWLRSYPKFASALASRDMTVAHLRHIKTKLDTALGNRYLRGDQDLFVDAARDCSFEDFEKVCDYWLVTIDPDGEEPKDQITRTKVTTRKRAGNRVHLDGDFDAVTGAAIEAMINHETNRLLRQDAADNIDRTPAQRQAAALFNLMQRGMQRKDGSYPMPLFNIVMSLKVAEWAKEQLDNPSSEPVPVDPFDVDGRCELIDGTVIHPSLVLALTGMYKLDHAELRRYVLEADSRILDYSSTARSFPEPMRTAANIEHRGRCATHGCDAPHHWLEIDHTNPTTNGGPTTLANAQPLCRPDNQAKTNTTGHQPERDKPPPEPYRKRKPPLTARFHSHHRQPADNDPDDHSF